MNFDDLHDPDPPRPGSATLAAVSGRARQIRRRRTALVAAGGTLAALAVIVPTALVVTGDDASDRLVPATVPTESVVTTAPTSVVAIAPDETVVIVPGTVPPASVPSGVPTTSTAPTTSTLTTVAPATTPPIVAIRADGDAVSIDESGTETVLYDGADPRVQPEEGELTIVDSVIVTPAGRVFVSTCCEPVPGSYQEIAVGTGPIENSFRYGHGLDLSPDGTRVVSVGASTVDVRTLDGEVVATAGSETVPTRMPYAAAWIGDDAIAVIELRQGDAGNEFRLLITDGVLSGYDTAEGVVIGTDIEAVWPMLAGVAADGSILVFQGAGDSATATALEAYDPVTLERRPASDVAIPAPATAAWSDDGVLTWIGTDGATHVGDAVVPGEYIWVRPIPG